MDIRFCNWVTIAITAKSNVRPNVRNKQIALRLTKVNPICTGVSALAGSPDMAMTKHRFSRISNRPTPNGSSTNELRASDSRRSGNRLPVIRGEVGIAAAGKPTE